MAAFNYTNSSIFREMYFQLFWSLGDGIKGLKGAQKGRKSWRKQHRFLCAYMRDNESERRVERKKRRGWTVQHTPDKGQRHVLFMMEAAAVEASGPRLLRACVLIPHEEMLQTLTPGQRTRPPTVINTVKMDLMSNNN